LTDEESIQLSNLKYSMTLKNNRLNGKLKLFENFSHQLFFSAILKTCRITFDIWCQK